MACMPYEIGINYGQKIRKVANNVIKICNLEFICDNMTYFFIFSFQFNLLSCVVLLSFTTVFSLSLNCDVTSSWCTLDISLLLRLNFVKIFVKK